MRTPRCQDFRKAPEKSHARRSANTQGAVRPGAGLGEPASTVGFGPGGSPRNGTRLPGLLAGAG